jgi:nucleoside-diphosphate-sugar epimerase
MSQVVVTGAAGFIGTHLVRRLAELGHSVVSVVRRPEQAAAMALDGNSRPQIADVSQSDSLKSVFRGAEVVYHLAGRIHARSLSEFRAVNAAGVRNVVFHCAEMESPPRIVLVSSLAAAGPSERGRPRRETDPAAPVSHYGESKLEGERIAHEWAKEVPISIVRPPFVFGGGDRVSLPLFRLVCRWGAVIVLRGHDLELSLIHVDDFIEALLAVARVGRRIEPCDRVDACETKSVGIYNPADPTYVSFTELGRTIGATAGRRVRVLRLRRPWLWGACAMSAGWARFTGRAGILNFDKLREATAAAWTCSNERSKAELDFNPAAPLSERLRQTADWYRRAGWL